MRQGPRSTTTQGGIQGYPFWVPLLLSALVLLLYLPSLKNSFLLDDWIFIHGNRQMTDFGQLRELLLSDYGSFDVPDLHGMASAGYYRPITKLTFFVDRWIYGIQGWGFHLTSMALHAIVVGLLPGFILRLGYHRRIALAAAALFAVHPIHTDAVLIITARSELLVAIFMLLGLRAYLRTRGQGWQAIAACSGAYLLGLLSKEMAVTLPVVILALEVVLPGPGWRARLRRLVPLMTSLLVTFLAYLFIRFQIAQVGLSTNTLVSVPAWKRGMVFLALLVRYFLHVLVPWRPIVHGPRLEASVLDAELAPYWAICIAALALIAWLCHKRSLAGVPGLFYLIAMLPLANYPLISVPGIEWHIPMAARWTYIPTMAFCLGLAYLVLQVPRNREPTSSRRITDSLLVLLGLCFGATTLLGIPDYRDDTSFGDRAARAMMSLPPDQLSPLENYAIHEYHARQATQAGQEDRAIEEYRKAIRLKPDAPMAWNNMANLLLVQGRCGEAAHAYQKALATIETRGATGEGGKPVVEDADLRFRPLTRCNLANAYLCLGEVEKAAVELELALHARHDLVEPALLLARIRHQQGDREAALRLTRRVLAIAPDHQDALALQREL